MAWRKGQSGNPSGTRRDLPWRAAVQRAVARKLEGKGDPKALDKLADKLVASGLKGDIAAIKEIGDRLDGKPAQIIGGDDDAPIRTEHVFRWATESKS